MRNYSNGLATREKILEAFKNLFCEKGYRGTTYARICDICQVNPGTITHHFTSKKNIAALFYDDMMKLYYKRAEELFPQEDDLQQVMIAAGMHQKLFYENTVYRRFSAEYSSDSIHLDNLNIYREHVPKAYKITRDRVGQKRADFLFVAFKGMDCFIEPYFSEHLDELSFSEVFEYIAFIYYQFVETDELKQRIKKSLIYLDGLEIKFDRFKVSVNMR